MPKNSLNSFCGGGEMQGTFTGRAIDYPEFKRGWFKVAVIAWDDGNQLEQMKQKVDLYTKNINSRCKDT